MLQQNTSDNTDAMDQFTTRFRNDVEFHTLVRQDTHAALAAVGIRVPSGVQVSFASDAASALNLALDQAHPTIPEGSVLDDSQLQAVAGGAGALADTYTMNEFFKLFRLDRT